MSSVECSRVVLCCETLSQPSGAGGRGDEEPERLTQSRNHLHILILLENTALLKTFTTCTRCWNRSHCLLA